MSDVIRCASCGQLNRVPDLGSGKRAVCGQCKTPLAAAAAHNGHPVELSDSNFKSMIGNGDYIVDFWAGWCGPCRIIAPVIEQLASERNDVHFAKVNVDENPRTSAAFGVQSIPMLVFFRNGAEVGRVTGAVPKAQIENAITRYFH
ncbi:MAG: thioredoxin [Acidobacteria bacterium]|nr:MAG: thioredoxin [Acidobacteriota bacterium]